MSDLPDDKFTPEAILDPYREEIARLRALLADARRVCSFVRDYWPGLEDGINWPQDEHDDAIYDAACRVCEEDAKG